MMPAVVSSRKIECGADKGYNQLLKMADNCLTLDAADADRRR